MYKFILLNMILLNCVFAIDSINSQMIQRNVELMYAQAVGYSLIATCVENAPNPDVCNPLYASYVACATHLNLPRPLVWNINSNNYFMKKLDIINSQEVANPYSPCGYEISHLILADKCNDIKEVISID